MTPLCPFCASTDTERHGAFWFCGCCARLFLALSQLDKQFLKRSRIAAD